MSKSAVDKIQEGRMAAVVSSYVVQFARKEQEKVLDEMIMSFKSGKVDFLSQVARLAFAYDMINDLERKIKESERLSKKMMSQNL